MEIDSGVVEKLIELGVLDKYHKIAPEAYVSATLRKPVDKQAEILGINLIIKAKRGNGKDIEGEFVKYFKNKIKANFSNDEGHMIKTMMNLIAPEFITRSKVVNFSEDRILELSKSPHRVNEWMLLNEIEKNILYSWFGAEPIFPPNEVDISIIDRKCLLARQKNIIVEGKNIDSKTSSYVSSALEWLNLWRSLSPYQWEELLKISMLNWEKMNSGWPDLSIFSEELGLTLVEIKGSDKIHNNQVYTLLKLKEVLGKNALAIGWVRELNVGRECLKLYNQELVSWMEQPVSIRGSVPI